MTIIICIVSVHKEFNTGNQAKDKREQYFIQQSVHLKKWKRVKKWQESELKLFLFIVLVHHLITLVS